MKRKNIKEHWQIFRAYEIMQPKKGATKRDIALFNFFRGQFVVHCKPDGLDTDGVQECCRRETDQRNEIHHFNVNPEVFQHHVKT